MANLLYQQIEMLSREKHIEPEVVVSAIEDAMVVAARKFYKTEEDLRGKFNPETGQVDVYSVLTVVEEVNDPKKEITVAEAKKKNPSAEVGTEILTPKPTDVLGRIAAQTAKQVILQKVREAERDTIFNEYNGRVGNRVALGLAYLLQNDLLCRLRGDAPQHVGRFRRAGAHRRANGKASHSAKGTRGRARHDFQRVQRPRG